MTEYAPTIDLFAADQLGLGLLADGGDLFDLSALSSAEGEQNAVPRLAALEQISGPGDSLAGLFALSSETAAEHGHSPYLQLAGLDTSALALPAEHHAAEPAVIAAMPETASGTAALGGHGPVLSLDDLLAAAADDLATFHTAAGAAPHHGPLGSGFFTPFNPAEVLPGLTEMHVLSQA